MVKSEFGPSRHPKCEFTAQYFKSAENAALLGLEFDADKKQDKADHALLSATAKDIGALQEYRSNGA